MARYTAQASRLIRQHDNELLWIEAWGDNSLRVRITRNAHMDESRDWALLQPPTGTLKPSIETGCSKPLSATIANGKLVAEITDEGWLKFTNSSGTVLLEEYWRQWGGGMNRFGSPLGLSAREIQGIPGGAWRATIRFEAHEGEKIFGMGQYQDPFLDKKGSVLELAHRNGQSSVPFYTSSRGYGFLWNNPAVGKVTFGRNVTEWCAPVTNQIDYWITAGDTPAEIQERYTEVTGRVPMMPEHGMGFTQCKLRYRTQEELMAVAREHKRRGLPIDMIVADFFHWPLQGDWRFDPEDWPDVEGMVKELKSMGIELMVSIWPTVDERSENRRAMDESGYLVQVDRGMRVTKNFMGQTVFFDPTNPGAREFIWKKAKENYFDKGIKVFWLDEAEPNYNVFDFDIYRLWMGPAIQVANVYPLMYARAFYDGLKAEGVENPMSLIRTAWAGSQRYGALPWSGDVHSSFRSMREQLAAGLSMAMAGIPWWTTDIGGFQGGDPDDEDFRELLVRWFQWGTFCPVFRLHGDRLPYRDPEVPYRNNVLQFGSGSDNEIWSFGDRVYPVLVEHLHLRERLRPYIRGLMQEAHEKGTPVMRPLFYDFPDDQAAWDIEDAHMFGPDLLVAPVMEKGVDTRPVYLPAGATWKDAYTGEVFEGGQTVEAPAPWEHTPVFLRNEANLPIVK
jgi:alpha-D-xyloside xylohydrolase